MQRSATELIALQPDLIVSEAPLHNSVAATNTNHPHHFRDRVRSGREWLCHKFSTARRNVTGFSHIDPTTGGKWLELLKEIAPRVARVAFLFNPATAPYAEIA